MLASAQHSSTHERSVEQDDHMDTEIIEIHMPDVLLHRLERLAKLTHRPLETLIVQRLSSTLPPLPDDLAPEWRDALLALESLSDDELQEVAASMMSEGDYERLSKLRDREAEGTLTPEEPAALESMWRDVDLLTLRKAYAAVLLKWRGTELSSPSATRSA